MLDPGRRPGDDRRPGRLHLLRPVRRPRRHPRAEPPSPWPSCCPRPGPAAARPVPRRAQQPPHGQLDLDSVYGPPAPRVPAPAKMLIGTVTSLTGTAMPFMRPAGQGRRQRPARGRSAAPSSPRPGGPHRRPPQRREPDHRPAPPGLPARPITPSRPGPDLREARRLLRHHYQHIVIHDFLRRVADPAIVDAVITAATASTTPGRAVLPATGVLGGRFRFGHTMVRDAYDFNLNFNTSGQPGRSRPRSGCCSPSPP